MLLSLPLNNREYTNCCLLLSVGTFRRLEIKFLIGNFTGGPIINFIPDWESEIVNQSGLKTHLSENLDYCAKMRAFQKKIFSLKDFFQAIRNTVRKRILVYKTQAVIQNLAIKCYHEFHLKPHDLEILILAAPFLLLTKVI